MSDKSEASSMPRADILIPVSVGELVDKITILQIKSERMTDRGQLANVNRELAALRVASERIECDPQALQRYTAELKRVNEALWEIEDAIRDCDAHGDFGETFIKLARSVYRHNDQRAQIKKAINVASGSRYSEEKSYAAFAPRRDPG